MAYTKPNTICFQTARSESERVASRLGVASFRHPPVNFRHPGPDMAPILRNFRTLPRGAQRGRAQRPKLPRVGGVSDRRKPCDLHVRRAVGPGIIGLRRSSIAHHRRSRPAKSSFVRPGQIGTPTGLKEKSGPRGAQGPIERESARRLVCLGALERLFDSAPLGALVLFWLPKFLDEKFSRHQQRDDGSADQGRGANLLSGKAERVVGDESRRCRCYDCSDRGKPPKDGNFRGSGWLTGR